MGVYGNYEWLPGAFKGKDIWIVASGPSVKMQFPDLNLEPLRGRVVFVISHMILFVPWADVMCILDAGPLQRLDREKQYSASYRVLAGKNTGLLPKGQVSVIKMSDRLSLNPSDGFFGNYSTGHFAISCALAAGASRVFLLGFDCTAPSNDVANCYDTAKVKGYTRTDVIARYGRMAKGFETFRPHAGRILNLSPTSVLETFPRGVLEDHL